MEVPLPDSSVDVVISQEALLHVPDKGRAMAEAKSYRTCLLDGVSYFETWWSYCYHGLDLIDGIDAIRTDA